jgi:hypothetical protein
MLVASSTSSRRLALRARGGGMRRGAAAIAASRRERRHERRRRLRLEQSHSRHFGQVREHALAPACTRRPHAFGVAAMASPHAANQANVDTLLTTHVRPRCERALASVLCACARRLNCAPWRRLACHAALV